MIKLSEIKLNEVTVNSYDRHLRYGTDWVTEYQFVTDKNLTKEEFMQVLKDKDICGDLKFIKKIATLKNGTKLFFHILETVMY